MAVYLALTAVTIILGMFIRDQGSVPGIHGRSRQQAVNFVMAAAIFCLLAGVSACRIAVGNDYWVYRDNFKLLMQGRHVSYEWGFNAVVWVIQSLFGYDAYLPVFGFFSLVTAYFFVKALMGQAEWFAASLFLLMTGSFYFNSFNSVRYYFALAIAVYAMKHVIGREYGKFILWILFGAFFHKSVLLVIPAYIAARWLAGHKLRKFYYVIGAALLASLFVFQDFYREIVFRFYPYYENSLYDKGDVSVINLVKCAGTLVLCLVFYRDGLKDNVKNRFYFFLNVAGTAVFACGSFIPEVSRIGYYLIISQIFLLPGVLTRIANKKVRLFFTAAVFAAFCGYFALYLRSAYDTSVRVLPYMNWIFD